MGTNAMASGEPHPCARCARAQATCCERAEILVTEGDRLRIGAHTGRVDFWERRAVLDPAYLEDDPADPSWRRATVAPDGTRAMLRRRPAGGCTFLGEAGCVLPEDTRPHVCRLYPFAYTAAGLAGEDAEYCPTALLDRSGVGMAAVLGMDAARAEGWRRQLYLELGIGRSEGVRS